MYVTIGEEVMLLSLEDATGAVKKRGGARWAVAGAGLLELVLAGKVEIDGEKILLRDATPTGIPFLDAQLADLERKRPRSDFWAPRLDRWLRWQRGKSVRAAGSNLVRRGVVREERYLLAWRYPEVDGAVERELRDRLEAVVLRGHQPDEHTRGLISLLHHTRMYRVAFPHHETRQVKPRMAEISEGEWAGVAVRKAIAAAGAAAAS